MVKNGARKKSSSISVCTETLVRSHVLTFASSAHAIIIVVNGINAKNAFFSANERSKGEGKGKEEEGKGRGRKWGKGKGNWK